jgi:Carboxypeptidase regulatory-like domain/TonB-dependent Receptor Plug Domain
MRMEWYKTLLVAFLLFPTAVLLAAGGKIHGKVTDRESGEALVGATVRVEGTSLGATTDVNGVFSISDLNAGTYTLSASYIGYQQITISNLEVHANLITEANFTLPAEGVKVPTVVIVAQRPLIEKSATNEIRIVNSDFLNSIPIRNVNEAAALQPGVVLRNNLVYVRGSRADETGFSLEGVNVTDIYNGGRGVTISQDAVDQMEVQTGGYPAEYGGANGGIIATQLRTGGEKLKASLRAETDNYTGQGKEALGGYSYGYSDYEGTISGPILSDKVRFFGTAENQFYRDPGAFVNQTSSGINGATGAGTNLSIASPRFWNGINFKGLVADPQFTLAHPNTAISDTLNLDYPAGNLIGGQLDQYSYTGTLLFDLENVQVRAAGSYSDVFSQDPASIADMFDTQRLPVNKYQNGFGNLKLTQFLTPKTYYELDLDYYRNYYTTGWDPTLQGNFTAYGGPQSNPQLNGGSTDLINSFYRIFGGNGVGVDQPGTLLATTPGMTSETSVGARLNFSTDVNNNSIKFGGEYSYYTIRHFGAAVLTQYDVMNNNSLTLVQKEATLRGTGYNNYGYDVLGNPIDNDLKVGNTIVDFGPPHPVNGAAYVEDQIELSDIDLNFGLRYDYIDPDSWGFKDPQGVTFNDSLNVVSTSSLVKTPVTQQISPRIGVSFPVSDMTVFHAQYGKFIQESELINSYSGMGLMALTLTGGNYIQTPVGYGLQPERTTQYELGFSQQIGDNASFDITTFYKNIADEIQFREILPDGKGQNRSYSALVNGDFATSKGVEMKVTIRRTDRVAAQLNYTFESAEGTGSGSNSDAGSATDQHGYTANSTFPTSFSQENTGSLNIDYRFAKDDGGPILQRAGINLLMQFGSGYPYTLETVSQNNLGDARFQEPLEPIGYSTTPWTYELDLRIDKTVTFGSLDAMFYIYVQNLLNTQNADNVFIATGDPANDGWLGSANGQAYATAQSDPSLYQSLYSAAFLGANANNYLSPRQIRFGVQIDY